MRHHRGRSKAGLWGGHLIHFIVSLDVENFLGQLFAVENTTVCGTMAFWPRGPCPLDRSSQVLSRAQWRIVQHLSPLL